MFRKLRIHVLILSIIPLISFSQVGVGTNSPNASSMLDVNSTSKGVLVPRMTEVERDAITTPSNGLLIYQIDNLSGFWYYNNLGVWVRVQSTSGWDINGNLGTNSSVNFLGTTDVNGIDFISNNNTAITVLSDGKIGIGETIPTHQLHLKGTSPILRIVDGTQGLNKILSTDATGKVSWVDNSILSATDQDWLFISGSTLSDPVYHDGPVTIGSNTLSPHELDVDNGLLTGTTIGIGDVEHITDGNFSTQFSHDFVPDFDNLLTFGSAAFRWNTIYAVNGTVQTSDANLKEDIRPLTYGVKDLMKLRAVTYFWKDEKHHHLKTPLNDKQLNIGFIAQELQKVIPEVVYSDSWKRKSEKERNQFVKNKNVLLGVNYEELIPVLVKAKQEQHKRINNLLNENDLLIKELESLIAKTK